MRLQGKTALITGGAKGIGKGIATRFIEEGADVIIVDMDRVNGEETANELGQGGGSIQFVELDVCNEDRVETFMKALPKLKLDILVNNVGWTGLRTPIDQMDLNDWRRILDINLTSLFLMCKHAVPLLKSSQPSSIVNLASVNAHTMVPALGAYSASKGGVLAITKQLAVELAPEGIRVNSVSPSITFREGTLRRNSASALSDKSLDCYPLGRFSTARDVANAVLFLGSEEAGFITGQDLLIDGGMTSQSVSAMVRDDLRAGWKSGMYKLEAEPEVES
ncbi:SDR family NAD(P)-dependent oxidoreductase [Paenibacillus agricola]|uniref:SDR family oxidoreductase n=1 Tax=Paenibacillus agricola TaxID=2716264 RepID=A0ABX0JAF8_9BACL|nr:SDR family oxidoreductase [Paenibacillus agricola]NHN31857.1 SDR family oxidoreductase [Paenibacillus agricola]